MFNWIKNHRPRWTTGLALAGVLGLGGFFVYDHFNDCCAEGADCCYPGSPCCAHGAHAKR
jgi:hypothetical protein